MLSHSREKILEQMESVDQEIAELQSHLSRLTSIHGDYRRIYGENKLLLQQNHHLLYPFHEQLKISVYYSVEDCESLVQSIKQCTQDQIINNAIREDFIQAQAQLDPSPAVSAFFGRRRGLIGDVVRSEEEMNIVLQDLMEQEKRSFAARWTNTLANIPEIILSNREHLEFCFLDNNRICDPFEVEERNFLEY